MALVWGAANLIIVVVYFTVGPRYFRNNAGYAMGGVAALMVLNGLVSLFILPPYVGSNTKYVGVTTDGKTLFLVHQVGGKSHTYVLEPWDVETGKRLGRQVPSIFGYDPYGIILRRGNQVWMRSGADGLHVRDLRTAAVVLSHDDLVARVPLLAGATDQLSRVDDAICMGSHDGYTLRLDPEAMTATRLPTGTGCSSSTPRSDPSPDPLVLTAGARRQVSRRGNDRVLLDPDRSWLAAEWVQSNRRTQRLDSPPSLLMTYQADGSHVPMLARIAVETGRALWTLPTGAQAGTGIDDVVVTGDGLLVITPSSLTMLDASNGHLRWSHDY
jgi:hypothetical protein